MVGRDKAAITSANAVPFGVVETSALSDPNNVPSVYSIVNEFHTTLFCGSGEVSFDRIRIPSAPLSSSQPESAPCLMPEGLYVLEISDGVNEDCVFVPTEEDSLEQTAPLVKLPCDVQGMMRVVRRLPPNTDVIVKIEPAEI